MRVPVLPDKNVRAGLREYASLSLHFLPAYSEFIANAAAAVRLSTLSFGNTISRCLFTVLGLRFKISPISRFVFPRNPQEDFGFSLRQP